MMSQKEAALSRDLSVKRLRSWQLKMTNGSLHPVFRNTPVYTNTPFLLVTQLVHVHYTPLCTKYYVFNTYCTPCLHKQSPCTNTSLFCKCVNYTPCAQTPLALMAFVWSYKTPYPCTSWTPPLHPACTVVIKHYKRGYKHFPKCTHPLCPCIETPPIGVLVQESCTSCPCIKTLPPPQDPPDLCSVSLTLNNNNHWYLVHKLLGIN